MSTLLQQINKQMGQKRSFFYWLTAVFNRVDKNRIAEVGADIACAEWLLRNGATVKWANANNYLNNYDALGTISEKSKQNRGKLFIDSVDATDSAISHEGFPHFAGCKFISNVKLINCLYISDEALYKLNYLRNSLKHLEIVNCGNVTDDGLDNLKQLTNLEKLRMSNLASVKNEKNIVEQLRKSLPKCEIIHE